MTRRSAVLAGAVLLLGACVPAVTHGPRVDPGLAVGATTGFGVPDDCEQCPGLSPTVAPYVRYGWRPGPGRPSVLASLGYRADLRAPQVDLYVQAPGEGAFAWGGGVAANTREVAPYVQLGRDPADGLAVFTTQMGVFGGRREVGGPGEIESEAAPRYWAPSVGVADGSGAIRWYGFVGGLLGDFREWRPDPGPSDLDRDDWPDRGRKPLRALQVGFGVEVPLGAVSR